MSEPDEVTFSDTVKYFVWEETDTASIRLHVYEADTRYEAIVLYCQELKDSGLPLPAYVYSAKLAVPTRSHHVTNIWNMVDLTTEEIQSVHDLGVF